MNASPNLRDHGRDVLEPMLSALLDIVLREGGMPPARDPNHAGLSLRPAATAVPSRSRTAFVRLSAEAASRGAAGQEGAHPELPGASTGEQLATAADGEATGDGVEGEPEHEAATGVAPPRTRYRTRPVKPYYY